MNSDNRIWGILLKVSLWLIFILAFLLVKIKFGWDPVKEYLPSDIKDTIPPSISVVIQEDSMEIKVNQSLLLQAQIMPECASIQTLDWHSNDTTVAYVDSTGLVTATNKGGRCVITAITTDGSKKSDSIIINVDKPVISTVDTVVKVEAINILNSNGEITLKPDSKIFKVKTEVLPKNALNKKLNWHSNKPSVATVDNDGTIIVNGPGDCTITITSTDGGNMPPKEIKVHVHDKEIKVTSISLDKSNVTIYVGNRTQVYATVLPANATNKKLNWGTSNESVASVNNGRIVGVGEGRCTITATSTDGSKIPSQCNVLVKPIKREELSYGKWSGSYLNGKPNGKGTIEFNKTILVADGIYANKGYTLRNAMFVNGKLISGTLYDDKENKISVIVSDIKL